MAAVGMAPGTAGTVGEQSERHSRAYRHVLCVFPYRAKIGGRGHFPPVGLEFIAATLEPHAEVVEVVDLRHETGRTTDLLRPDTDLVCFSVNWEWELDLVREEIRSVPQSILTMVGGRHATENPEKWLSQCPNIDILVRGDGEEIVEEIAQGRAPEKTAGVSCRLNGEIVHGPKRHVGQVSDDLYPNRQLRRYPYALDVLGCRTGLTLDLLASSRGCPFNCKFCSFNRNPWGTKRNWSGRSPESVVRELEEIDASIVVFVDANFTQDMDRAGAISDLIVSRGIRKRYIVNARVECAKRPDVLRKMERAGFSMLLLGVESAQDKTLRSMNKGFGTKRLREYFRVLRGSKMILNGYFIIGNIGEDEAQMRQIGPFATELGLDTAMLSLLRNDPYSGLEELIASAPGYHIAPDGLVYSDRYSVERLRQIRHDVNRSFYTPRQYMRILWKVLRNRLITPAMLVRLPWVLGRRFLESWRRSKLRLRHGRGDQQGQEVGFKGYRPE